MRLTPARADGLANVALGTVRNRPLSSLCLSSFAELCSPLLCWHVLSCALLCSFLVCWPLLSSPSSLLFSPLLCSALLSSAGHTSLWSSSFLPSFLRLALGWCLQSACAACHRLALGVGWTCDACGWRWASAWLLLGLRSFLAGLALAGACNWLAQGMCWACAGLGGPSEGLGLGVGWARAGLALGFRSCWACAPALLVLRLRCARACADCGRLVLLVPGFWWACAGRARSLRRASAGLSLALGLRTFALLVLRVGCAGFALGLCWAACAGLELGLGWAWAALVLLAAHTQPVQQVDGHQVHRARYPPLPVTHPMSPAGPWPPDETIAFGQPAPHPRR